MSEFGNETLTATMKLNEKTIDAMVKLLRFVLEKEERELNKELKRLQFDKVKSESDILKAEEFLARKKGVVQARDMIATGKEIVPLSIPMNERQFERFGQLARDYGINTYCTSTNIIYNQMKELREKIAEKENELSELEKVIKKEQKVLDSDKDWKNGLSEKEIEEKLQFNSKLPMYKQKELELNNEKRVLEKRLQELSKQKDDKIAWVFAKDLQRVKAITDRMNNEVMVQKCNERIEELQSKDSLTKEEQEELHSLLSEKEGILNNEFEGINSRNNDVVLSSEKEEYKNLSFDEAMGTVSDRKYGEQPCYICNRINPNDYAKVSIEKRANDKNPNLPPTTVTLFDVYKNGIQQECHINNFPHNRFEHWSNRKGENSGKSGKDYWQQMKEQMKETLTDDVIIFPSEKEYLVFKEEFEKMKNEKLPNSLPLQNVEKKKDYIEIIEQLKTELKDNGIVLNEKNELCDKETGEQIKFDSKMSINEKLEYKEAMIIKEQVNTCEQLYKKQIELNTWQEQLNMNKHNLETLEDTDERISLYRQMGESLHTEVYKRTQDVSSLETKLTNLQGEREKILSVSAYGKLKHEKSKDRDEFNHGDEMSYEDFKEKFDSEKEYKASRENWDSIVQDSISPKNDMKNAAKEIETSLEALER